MAIVGRQLRQVTVNWNKLNYTCLQNRCSCFFSSYSSLLLILFISFVCCLPLASFISCAWLLFWNVRLFASSHPSSVFTERHILISFGLLFLPAKKNQFITCNLINFLVLVFFVRCHSACSLRLARALSVFRWMSTHGRCWTWNECDFILLVFRVGLFLCFHSLWTIETAFCQWHSKKFSHFRV